jgi:ankyrin repeat protein
MQFLLDSGLDVNAFDVSIRPPTVQAPRGTALHVAAHLGMGDRIDWLLERGPDPNARETNKAAGMTAAEWAKRYGEEEIYELLSRSGISSQGSSRRVCTLLILGL